MVIRRRKGLTGQFAPRALGAVLAAVALVGTGCSSDGLRAGDAATIGEGSVAQIAIDGGEWEAVEGGTRVPEGAQVKAAEGETVLDFGDAVLRLAPGSVAVVDKGGIELSDGEALVEGSGLDVVLGDTTVAANGSVRVSSGLSSRVGVYEGTAVVRRPAQRREVTALRELDLAPFRLAATADPLQYLERDPWDAEFLGDAIAFDDEAARLARGIDVEIGRAPLRPGFYATFAGDQVVRHLDTAARVQRRGAFGPPSDVLLTVFVSQAVSGPLGPSVQRVAALRGAGARWGLITMELDVAGDRVVAAIDQLGERRLATAADAAAVVTGVRGAARRASGDAATGDRAVAVDTTDPQPPPDDPMVNNPTPDDGPGDGPGDDGPDDGPGDDEDTVTQVGADVVTSVGGGEDADGKSPVDGLQLPQLP